MLLNRLRPAWRYFKWQNQQSSIEEDYILDIIESTDTTPHFYSRFVLMQSLLLMGLLIGCQGS